MANTRVIEGTANMSEYDDKGDLHVCVFVDKSGKNIAEEFPNGLILRDPKKKDCQFESFIFSSKIEFCKIKMTINDKGEILDVE